MNRLPNSLRPGVFVYGQMVSAAAHRRSGVAAVAQAAQELENIPETATKIERLEDALVFGETSALYQMVEALLAAGASPVYALAAGTDYAAAFEKLDGLEELSIVVCDGGAQTLPAALERAAQLGQERVAVIAAALEQAPALAAQLCCERVAVACDGGSHTVRTAAAFAAAIAACGAQQSLNGLALPLDASSFDGTLTTAQVEMLLAAGVTPFVRYGSAVECVRALTSRAPKNRTWASVSSVLAVDEVLHTIRGVIKSRLKGRRNNLATRESIASQITVELERLRIAGVIESFQPPIVQIHPKDPAIAEAVLQIQVAPELNQIVISAELLI